MKKILGSIALLAALAIPAAAAENVLCRVSGYASAAVCSSQPAAVGSALPLAPGTATAGVSAAAARDDHRHPVQPKSYTLLTSGSGTFTVPSGVTICDVSATGGGGGGGGAPLGFNSGAGGNGASGHIEIVCW